MVCHKHRQGNHSDMWWCVHRPLMYLEHIYSPGWQGISQLYGSKMVLWVYVEQGCTVKFHRGKNLHVSVKASDKACSQHPCPGVKAVLLNRGRWSCSIWACVQGPGWIGVSKQMRGSRGTGVGVQRTELDWDILHSCADSFQVVILTE